ncbi:MAG: protein-disulfide reductase DsbD family protein [Bacteroidales bacterium]
MKKIKSFALLIILLISAKTTAQIIDPIDWSFEAQKVSETEYNLILKAKMDEGWHIYSQHIGYDGPIPTTFTFNESDSYSLKGETVEPTPEKEYDESFEMDLLFFSDEVEFIQPITINNNKNVKVEGSVEFMACNLGQCMPPETVEFTINVIGDDEADQDAVATTPQEGGKKNSLLRIFLLGFLSGLIALVTPCIWPMIPVTVSYFLKSSQDKKKGVRKAFAYGISIVIIYVLLGLGITLIFGADALNSLATNPWFNIVFFVLFVLFAIAFLGGFELTLPSSWVNKMDSKADKSGGFLGIFFMAFTLVLVSFSCTGPIIGTLLVEAVIRGTLAPFIGMLGFSLALAIPFTLFAIFPSWLSSLPKSGGWLNSVKVVLGFVELALALKFLSIADLTMHWRILDRETFVALWIVLSVLLGLYLLGKLKFKHDSDLQHISVFRLFLSIICFSFAVYMLPGLWGAPLKSISAFAPPMYTQDFDINRIVRESTENLTIAAPNQNVISNDKDEDMCVEKPKYSDFLHIPGGLKGYFDYEEGMSCARSLNKPVLIDFTGHGCVNCRNMEVAVWPDPQVKQILKDNFVIIELYVDDKTKLPDDEITTVELGNKTKKIKTLGNKWSYYQASKFNSNSQPFFVIVDPETEEILTDPYVYNLDPNNFVKFLNKGLENYNK